ncbi:hypothetical protein Leryth_002723 [Lithospermum erythrorhizon]|nr:hypothetical protein Leryth_002723 [Lithospermum erythrorhizon]
MQLQDQEEETSDLRVPDFVDTEMISLSNGELVNRSLDKWEFELGDHSRGSTPKYKQRKVFAVRDFPVECGPNHQLVHSHVEGNDVATVENDNVCHEVMPSFRKIPSVEIESQSAKAGLDSIEEADRLLDSVVETTAAFSMGGTKIFVEEMKNDVQHVGLSFPKRIYKEAADAVKDFNVVETFKESVKVEESLAMDNVVDEKVKPMLDVGSSVSGIAKAKPISEDGLSIQRIREDTKPMLIEGYSVNGSDSVDALNYLSLMELELSDSIDLDKRNHVGSNDKFRRGRVSAIRDFPLCCRPNVIGPTSHTSSVHLKRDDLGALSVSNVEIMLTGTKTHGTEELLEVDLHGSRIEKSEPRLVVSEGAEKSAFRDTKYSDGNQASGEKEVILHSQYRNQESKSLETASGTVVEDVREVVHGIMAGPYCPWKQDKSPSSNSLDVMNDGKMKKDTVSWRRGVKAVAKKSIFGGDLSKRNSFSDGKFVDDFPGSMIGKGNRKYDSNCAKRLKAASSVRASSFRIDGYSSSPTHGSNHSEILPPVTGKSSSSSDARKRVKDILRLFQSKCKKILQEEEAKSEPGRREPDEKTVKRIDLHADKRVRNELKIVNAGKIMGVVPGVEVGDEFQYRVELSLIGVHSLYQAGIDYLNRQGKLLAISVVASGAYADDMENPEVLIYSGQGGNIVDKNKNPEDQKLVRGNLALKNSIKERNLVRVIRGSKENKGDKIVTTYVYDGVYTVNRYYTETGQHGKMVFMFELRREPGQPELSWKEVKLSKKYKRRHGVCVDDISGGKESFPVCAVNTFNNEEPPAFTYVTQVMYPDWFRPSTAKGCDCTGRCSDSRKCLCAVKNGGGIPYNYNGAIVEAKPIVYECGPSCKCPPSCYNRVTQRGSNIQLEIFKTERRGWGVRSLSFIPSGTFICEYAGELLEDKEAEQRTNDEYLFDIGRNGYNSKTEGRDPIDAEEDGGYTIDAARYGNVGRFVNHSCSPNLYAQDVLNDHADPRMPHIMLFAAENINSLQELTYDYNYSVGQVSDSDGNIKVKNCYCGSTACTGRMY